MHGGGEERRGGGEARESVRAGTLGHRFTRLPLFYDPAKCRPPPLHLPPCPAPTPTIGRQGQAAELDSILLDSLPCLFLKTTLSLSLSLSEKLTSFVRQYQGRGSGSGGGGGPRAAASSPCVEVNLACCSYSRERGDRRESFLNEEEMEDKREVIPLVIEGRREGRVLGYAQVSRPCFTAP